MVPICEICVGCSQMRMESRGQSYDSSPLRGIALVKWQADQTVVLDLGEEWHGCR